MIESIGAKTENIYISNDYLDMEGQILFKTIYANLKVL